MKQVAFTVPKARWQARCTAAAIATASLCGCASVSQQTTEWFSSNTPVIGVIEGRVLWGQANFVGTRRATVQLQTPGGSGLACSGMLQFTASTSGTVNFACSDGRAFSVPFQAFSALSGAGRPPLGHGDFGLAYGLSPDAAAGYLALPAERLVRPAGP